MPAPGAPRAQSAVVNAAGLVQGIALVTFPAASTGSPIQNPRPLKTATNTGATAVPRPSSAFRTSTDLSTAAGCSAAARVLRAGTESPNPAPRHAVAPSSSA